MRKIYILAYIRFIYFLCAMEKTKNNRITVKKTGFSIRTTETFLKQLQYVSDKKEMTKTDLIEHLVRREYEKLTEK